MRKLLLTLCGIFAITLTYAQQGTLAGKVVEEDSGFEIIGGTVLIVGTTDGTATDLDGSYQLKLDAGSYEIEFSYVGLATQIIPVEIKAGELTSLDVLLGTSAVDLGVDVTVVGKASRSSVAALMTLQKKAPVVVDGIGSQQIAQSGDNDVASAVRRVTGVTVEGGKYVYVRGLGDRYSKTTLNGAEIPGLDPNRNTVQMDLFPTNLIDNILVYKTFSPNLPGDFSGGFVDIATKDFPEQFTLNASVSAGYNTNATFNSDFLTYNGGGQDWLGMDDGTRALPELVAQNQNDFPEYSEGLLNGENAQKIADLTRSFDNNWGMTNDKPFLNHNFSISVGDQKELFGKPLGLIAAVTYQRNYSAYSNGQYGIHELTGNADQVNALNTQLLLNDQKGTDEVLWGGMLSSTYKITPSHKIGFMLMRNQSGTSTARSLEGRKFRDDPDEIFQTRTWQYLERSLSTAQLNGKHVFTGLNNLEIDWLSSYSVSEQDEPDLRYFTNRYLEDQGRYRIKPSSDNVPTRFYRNMTQFNFDNKLNVTVPFTQWNGLKSAFKTGVSYVVRDREFRETRFNFNNQNLSFSGNTFDYFQESNLIQAGDNGFASNPNGVYVTNNYDPKNNYDADQTVFAAYAMVDMPLTDKLRAITGARMETTSIRLKTFDTDVTLDKFPQLDGEQKVLDNLDILPSLNLNYEMNDEMKVRFGYSRTLARPSFREVAPFASFAVDGGFVFVGNPDLERTLIDNLDLRWELFQGGGEMFSVSAFYKNFNNPIERTFNPEAQNTELTLRNVDNAFLIGGEIEVRKKLGFIADAKILNQLTLGANFSYIYSQTDISEAELALIQAQDPDASTTREMFGQAPYVVNALLSYKNEKGTQANVSFNMVGPRISVVTRGATPNYYQKPQPTLNFNVSHKLTPAFKVKLSANNILDAKYQEVATFKGEEYPIQVYELGRNFSVGLSYNLAN